MASILVVEDDKSMNEILVTTLQEADHTVETAFSGPEALEICGQKKFDLLITDVRLPGLDGVEAIGKIKKMQKKLKCIVITGYASEDTPVRAIRLNVDDYLFKPFSLKYFHKSVDRVLNEEVERRNKKALFAKLFERFGLSIGNEKDAKLEDLVDERQEAFRGLYVGVRSGYLEERVAADVYTSLESLENRFRKFLNATNIEKARLDELRDSYVDIHERLALLEIGAFEEEEAPARAVLPKEDFEPLYLAVKESEISLGDLLYAPLLRKTPDARFEAHSELLELKRKLWPSTEAS